MKKNELAVRIGMAVKFWRRNMEITQQKLVEKIGISQVTLSAIELGKTNGRVSNLNDITRGLKIKLSELIHTAEDLRL